MVGGSLSITGKALSLVSVNGSAISTITIPDTTIPAASATTAGTMSAADYTKLSGIAMGATKVADSATNGNITINGTETTVYAHPSGKLIASSSFVKIITDAYGHVTAASSVTSADIAALGVKITDTTYSAATTSTAGLMSATDKSKIDGVASGAQVNVIEKVSVNGTALSISSKGVNIDLSGYALKTDVTAALHYKGSVDAYSDLPTSASVGDMYNVAETGMNYVWSDAAAWDEMAPTITLSAISTSTIDALFA